jgi:hypothetical protein
MTKRTSPYSIAYNKFDSSDFKTDARIKLLDFIDSKSNNKKQINFNSISNKENEIPNLIHHSFSLDSSVENPAKSNLANQDSTTPIKPMTENDIHNYSRITRQSLRETNNVTSPPKGVVAGNIQAKANIPPTQVVASTASGVSKHSNQANSQETNSSINRLTKRNDNDRDDDSSDENQKHKKKNVENNPSAKKKRKVTGEEDLDDEILSAAEDKIEPTNDVVESESRTDKMLNTYLENNTKRKIEDNDESNNKSSTKNKKRSTIKKNEVEEENNDQTQDDDEEVFGDDDVQDDNYEAETTNRKKRARQSITIFPNDVSMIEDLKGHILKAFNANCNNKSKDSNANKFRHEIISLDNENSKYYNAENFLIFKNGNIELETFKNILVNTASQDIRKSLLQERIILEFILTIIRSDNASSQIDSPKLPAIENLALWLNGLNLVFYKFGETAVNNDSELTSSLNQLAFVHTDSLLSMFKDIRNCRKMFSKLFYGSTRKSLLKYLFNESSTEQSSLYDSILVLQEWSQFDCNSFEVDEGLYQRRVNQFLGDEKGLSIESYYPLSVMHDHIHELLYPSMKCLIDAKFVAHADYSSIDAEVNRTLYIYALCMTAELLYKNKTKRDLIPDYVQLYDLMTQFVDSMLSYEIFPNVKKFSDIDFYNVDQYFKIKEDQIVPVEKSNPKGRGRNLFKIYLQKYSDSIAAFIDINRKKIEEQKVVTEGGE